MPTTGMPDPAVVIVSFALLALAPFLAVMVTSFAKLVVVLSLVRNALGLQQVPPNLVISGLALVLSLYVMAPVVHQVQRGVQSQLPSGELRAPGLFRALETAREPLRGFLSKHTNEVEREFFLRSAGRLWPEEMVKELTRDDLLVVVPAFTVSELTAAFKIGFLVYIGFVVVDLVVANILVALGMMMFSPTVVSIPLKLLLFVLLDGWSKLVHGLILTYA
jgi:type III secretion protein R